MKIITNLINKCKLRYKLFKKERAERKRLRKLFKQLFKLM